MDLGERHGAYDGGFLQLENKNMVAVEMIRTEGLELAAPMVDLSSKPSFPEPRA